MEKNLDKQERYIKLKAKLKKAIKNEFWFEACMIEYAIIEDRTSSILFYSKVCKDPYDSSKKLSNKLNSILHQIGKEHFIIAKKVNTATIDKIKAWKEKRNDLVHRSCMLFDETLAKEVALEGGKIVSEISNASARVTRYSLKMEM